MKLIRVTGESDFGAMIFEDYYTGSYYDLWKEAKEKGEATVIVSTPSDYQDEDMEPEVITVTAYEFEMSEEAFEFFTSNFIDYDAGKCTNIFKVEETE
jgi:hypothetical protein